MKVRILIMFVFLSFNVFSQNITMLEIMVFEDCFNTPIKYKEAILYNSQKVLDHTFSPEDGTFTFIIDSLPFNSDSVYFLINTGDTLSSHTKIFINHLGLLENNKIGNYLVKITDFKRFTEEEFRAYRKKSGTILGRKKVLAKDVD